MTDINEDYRVSNGEADEQYGLFIMKSPDPENPDIMPPAYFYDIDKFTFVTGQQLDVFVKPDELEFCTDENGKEYRGEELQSRINDAIKAFENALPTLNERKGEWRRC